MGLLPADRVNPGDVSSATEDDAVLDDVAAEAFNGSNVRTGAITLGHFSATRNATPASASLPITTWIDTVADDGGSDHDTATPGTVVSPGGADMELTPPGGARGTLAEGDILRWHFSAVVTVVDFTTDEAADRYSLIVEVDGTDDNGSVTLSQINVAELGIVRNFSMNTGGVPSTVSGAGINKEIQQQRIEISGVYIHLPSSRSVFSANGGGVHIDAIRVRCYVQTATNMVTLDKCRFTALICKG